MKNTIKTSQAEGQPLSPIGHDCPNATTQTAENGTRRDVDTGAVLKDDRPYSQLFQAELAAGNLDQFENPNQVNKHLQALKGASAPCTYFVNARSHGWARVNGKWVAPTEEWVKANPYVAGTRGSKAIGGMLSDAEKASIEAQLAALALVPDAVKPTVQAIIDGLNAKLLDHEKAVEAAAITQAAIHARRNALACLERILKAMDSKGIAWESDLLVSLRLLGAALPDDQLAACMTGYPESK